MIRATETSVLSYVETGNLYVQQLQKGFQIRPNRLRNRVGGLTSCGNTICRLIMLTIDLSIDRIRLIEHLTQKKSSLRRFFILPHHGQDKKSKQYLAIYHNYLMVTQEENDMFEVHL